MFKSSLLSLVGVVLLLSVVSSRWQYLSLYIHAHSIVQLYLLGLTRLNLSANQILLVEKGNKKRRN
jgi:hypothetical protein